MLEGKHINLRLMEKEDASLLFEVFNKPEILGEYNPLKQISRTDMEK